MNPLRQGRSLGSARPESPYNSENEPKRRKLALACDRCRSKKIKCDANRPVCGQCAKRRSTVDECAWLHALVREDSQASREHIDRLEKQIKDLQRQRTDPPPSKAFHGAMDTTAGVSSEMDARNDGWRPARESAPAESLTESSLGHSSTVGWNEPSDLSISRLDEQNSAMIGSVAEADERLVHFGSSSIGSFMTTVREVVNRSTRSAGGPRCNVARSDAGASRNVDTTMMNQSKPHGDSYLLPQRTRADALMATFWQTMWPLAPLVSKLEIMSRYNDVWTGQGNSGGEPEFLCILNTIFALSTLIDGEANVQDTTEAADAFFQRARDLLILWRPASLQRVQAFLLLALYLQATNESHQCWMFVGYAVRVAQSLGLHWPQTTDRITSLPQREEWRRVWHFCIHMDRLLAMVYGRPSMIKQSVALHAPRPLSVDEQNLPAKTTDELPAVDDPQLIDFFIQSQDLFNILSEILEEFYDPRFKQMSSSSDEHEAYFGVNSPNRKSLPILEIDQKLSKWEQSLPKHLRTDRTAHSNLFEDKNPSRTKVLVRQAIVLRQRYLHIRILSLRPILASFVSFEADNSKGLASFDSLLARRLAHQCSVVCCKVAQEAIDIVYSNLPKKSNTGIITAHWWYNVFYVYSAATVLIAARLDPSIISELTEASILESWQHALDVLQAYTKFSESTHKLLTALHLLFDEVPVRYSQHTQSTGAGTSNDFNHVFGQTNYAENVPRTQFNFVSDDGRGNNGTSFPFNGEMAYSLDNEAMFGQLDVTAFGADEMFWLNTVPFDF